MSICLIFLSNIKRASDLVKTNKKLKPLSDYILGDLFIIDQLESEYNNKKFLSYNFVDIRGNFSGNDIVIKNKKFSEHGNIIGRQEKLDLISKEIEEISKKTNKIR